MVTKIAKFFDYFLAALFSVITSITAYGVMGDATVQYDNGTPYLPVIRLSLFVVMIVFTFFGSAHILQRLSHSK